VIKVGISAIESPLFKVYPNPTTGIVYLEISGGMNRDGEVVVTNLAGAEVFRKEIKDENELQIDLSNLVNGIYLLKVSVDNQHTISKILVRKE